MTDFFLKMQVHESKNALLERISTNCGEFGNPSYTNVKFALLAPLSNCSQWVFIIYGEEFLVAIGSYVSSYFQDLYFLNFVTCTPHENQIKEFLLQVPQVIGDCGDQSILIFMYLHVSYILTEVLYQNLRNTFNINNNSPSEQ